MDKFDYYIFIDYSEDLIGYNIIESKKLEELLPKISTFVHYRKKAIIKKESELVKGTPEYKASLITLLNIERLSNDKE